MNISSNNSFQLEKNQIPFLWYDYASFLLMLSISTLVSIYYGSKQKTINEYLLGSKKMTAIPVAISVAVGHFSAIGFIAFTADGYRYGAYLIFACISMILIVIISAYIYFPVFFKLQLTSTYEYLEMRFDRKTKMLISSLYILSELVFLSVSIYAPSLALSTATGFNVDWIGSIICAICVFYTTVGGLKAVVWTDFFQLLIIATCLLTINVIGTLSNGGVLTIWNTALEGRRLDIFDFDLNPTKRDSFWIYVVGYTAHFTNYISLTQSGVQKFLSLPTFKECVKALVYMAFCMILMIGSIVFNGLAIYAKYSRCDPLANHEIQRYEQIVPFYIMDLTKYLPGLFGFFIVALFCASLSTISSSLNALSGVIYKDYLYKKLKNYNEKTTTNVLKILVLLCGGICISFMFVIKHLGELGPLATSVTALSQGPSMGAFTLGVLFPKANAKGAFYGIIGSFFLTSLISMPLKIYQMKKKFTYKIKPVSIEGCRIINNSSNGFDNWTNSTVNSSEEIPFMFRISYFYHTFLGAVFTIILGLLISYITNRKKGKIDNNIDKNLISPICHRFLSEKLNERELQDLLKNHCRDRGNIINEK